MSTKSTIPAGLHLLGYQEEGVQWLSERRAGILADEMGLGKTIQLIAAMNDIMPRKTLIICPASLKLNWEAELHIWYALPADVQILWRRKDKIRPSAEVLIVNFEMLLSFRDDLRKTIWDLVIVDEAHYLKNPEAQRTSELFGGEFKCRKLWLLTGTPMKNRPIDMYPLLKAVGALPQKMTREKYGIEFCGAKWIKDRFGSEWWDKGATQIEKLSDMISPFYLRRKKIEVLAELPEKRRQILHIDRGDNWIADGGINACYEIGAPKAQFIDNLTAYRKAIGLLKAPLVAKHVEETRPFEKSIIFCYHHDVVEKIAEKISLPKWVIYGPTEARYRPGILKAFKEAEAGVLIGSYGAMGEGLNIQCCDYGIWAELPWTPAELEQAEARMHRMGQKNRVLIQYAIQSDSIDAIMAKILTRKQNLIRDLFDWIPIIKKGLDSGDIKSLENTI